MPESPVPVASEGWLVEQWTAKLASAVASMMGDAPAVAAGSKTQEILAGEDIVWWEQPFSVSPEAMVWVGAPALSWQTIGNEVLKSAGIDDADNANIKSTFVEILNQSLGGIAQALTSRFRGEVTCAGGGETTTVPANSLPVTMTLGEAVLTLYMASSKALVDLCERSATARSTPETALSSPQPQNQAETDKRGYPKGLDLLLDVELPLSVSFGHAELPIKDVIKLTTGSIVELNRSIAEPVEIIVNNVVIARGEVVVVEGNFGVRIKQVISRQQRLRTLK
jgi:flagellar motor switch protein FliN/FliY